MLTPAAGCGISMGSYTLSRARSGWSGRHRGARPAGSAIAIHVPDAIRPLDEAV
jgi:hypothetical protein